MTNSRTIRLRRLFICFAIFSALLLLPLLSSARSAISINPTTSINIVNNSNRPIRYVYLSHVDVDDWSADQLGGNGIPPGQSSTVSNVSWAAQQIKVIAEDQDGCFSYMTVTSGVNSTWTITNSTAVDCGN